MNHQPFEQLLLSEDPLTPEEKQLLDCHLDTCPQCRKLQQAWYGVNDLFQEVPDVAPIEGFTHRWLERLETEKQLEQVIRYRWQSVIILILFANVITVLIIFLGTQFFPAIESPMTLILSGIYRLLSTMALINTLQNISFTLLGSIISVVPVGIWALLGVGLIGSIATWIVSIASLSVLPRRM